MSSVFQVLDAMLGFGELAGTKESPGIAISLIVQQNASEIASENGKGGCLRRTMKGIEDV